MKNTFKDKKVLITGGAGSVGKALTKRLLEYGVNKVRILDISENELFRMRNLFGDDRRLRYLIGDIRDGDRLRLAMEGINIVVHLAAMKHVYACEYNPFEAIKTNIDGLQNVINTARNEDVEKVIFSSTDKAARPLSVMGTTKLLGERLISVANYYKGDRKTLFASVRFGNVIGSNGSVVPLFKEQISKKSGVTVTDEGMTRFVITMEEAVDLICSAVVLTKGQETFVWKMRTLRVMDLLEAMKEKYGTGREVKTVVIGKGEGEKIHEDIMTQEELSRAVELEKLYIIHPSIDYLGGMREYNNARTISSPVISSNMGRHMTRQEIMELLGAGL